MKARRATTLRDLRAAVDCLPRRTRLAMLEGISRNSIIVGAYSDPNGICPMLAAHRAGGRTDCIAFARAWDRFALGPARAAQARRARRATDRELRVLVSQLEASLLDEELPPSAELAGAVAEHRALREARRARESRAPRGAREGDPDRSRELRRAEGWAWTRAVRRLDDYERALAWVREHEQLESSPPRAAALAGSA